jgi:riboflavin synthase alpha subunit
MDTLFVQLLLTFVTMEVGFGAKLKLQVRDLDDHRRDSRLPQSWQYIRNGTGLIAINGTSLTIDCVAFFPIKWNLTGDMVRLVMKFRFTIHERDNKVLRF